jgi:hypothetical protein
MQSIADAAKAHLSHRLDPLDVPEGCYMTVSLRLDRLFVAFGETAYRHLQGMPAGTIRMRFAEFQAFAAGVAEAKTESEKSNRIREGLAFFRIRNVGK